MSLGKFLRCQLRLRVVRDLRTNPRRVTTHGFGGAIDTDGDISGSFRVRFLTATQPMTMRISAFRREVRLGCGCTDETASNYDENATSNDGSACTTSWAAPLHWPATTTSRRWDGLVTCHVWPLDAQTPMPAITTRMPPLKMALALPCVPLRLRWRLRERQRWRWHCGTRDSRTDANACNYSSGATDVDGSCELDVWLHQFCGVQL